MALEHASSGQVIEVLRRDGGDLSQFSAIALARTDELELIRMCMPKGKTMPEHHVLGEITVTTQVNVNGVNADNYTDAQLFDMIRQQETEIKH